MGRSGSPRREACRLPRNCVRPTRIRSRCEMTGPSPSTTVYRKNKLSDIALRELGSRAGSGS